MMEKQIKELVDMFMMEIERNQKKIGFVFTLKEKKTL